MCIVYGLNLLANLENKVGTAIDGLAVSLAVDGLVRLQLGYGLTQFLEVALARVVCKFDYEFLTSFPLSLSLTWMHCIGAVAEISVGADAEQRQQQQHRNSESVTRTSTQWNYHCILCIAIVCYICICIC